MLTITFAFDTQITELAGRVHFPLPKSAAALATGSGDGRQPVQSAELEVDDPVVHSA